MGKKNRLKKLKKARLEDAQSLPSSEESTTQNLLQKIILPFLLTVILAIGIVLRVHSLGSVAGRSPDEGIYTFQANTIAQNGIKSFRSLVNSYNEDETLWPYPHPLRVGYLISLATVMKITNIKDVKAGAYLSCSLSIASLLLVMLLGLRFFNQWITLYALLFLSVSPMSLAIARRSWQEAMLEFIGALLIYFCCEITHASNRKIWYVFFILTGSFCILIKLSGVVIYGLSLLWVLWVLFIKEKSFPKGFLVILSSTLGMGMSILFLLHLTGGVSAVKEVLTHLKWALQTSEYARNYGSGPWYQFFEMLWMLTPLNTVLVFAGIIGTFSFIKIQENNDTPSFMIKNREMYFGIIFFMTALMAALFLFKDHFLNLRYVSSLYLPFYLISGLGFWHILLLVQKKMKNFSFTVLSTYIMAALACAAVIDYKNFERIIVKSGILDLTIGLLKRSLP